MMRNKRALIVACAVITNIAVLVGCGDDVAADISEQDQRELEEAAAELDAQMPSARVEKLAEEAK